MSEASATLNQISGALDGLANEPLRLVPEDRSFQEMWGWNQPAINRHEFATLIRSTIPRIQKSLNVNFSTEDVELLKKIPNEINFTLQNAMPNLAGGNSFHVYIVIETLNKKINQILDKYLGEPIDWEEVSDKSIFPVNLVNQVRQLHNEISGIRERKKGLDDKVNQILEAAAASKTLKNDLEALRDARESYLGVQRAATEHQITIEQARAKAEAIVGSITTLESSASALVANTQAAFAAATTVGLGSEFDAKARALAKQVKWLSVMLAVILGVAGCITYQRLDNIQEMIEGEKIDFDMIWVNLAMTFASLSAPVWAAWILTKQIGQRFRLSEDYGFKATVAKAYAGYRQEATRLNDTNFEKRLFDTALNRIDEAPLRYVERENEGSPFQSLFSRRKEKPESSSEH